MYYHIFRTRRLLRQAGCCFLCFFRWSRCTNHLLAAFVAAFEPTKSKIIMAQPHRKRRVCLGLLLALLVAFVIRATSAFCGVAGGSRERFAKCLALPPGKAKLPVLGDTLDLLNPKKMVSYQVESREKWGPRWTTNLLFKPAVVITSAEDLALARRQEARPGTFEAFFPPHHQRLHGKNSLIVQSGSTHARLRRLIQSAMMLGRPYVDVELRPLSSMMTIKGQSLGGCYLKSQGHQSKWLAMKPSWTLPSRISWHPVKKRPPTLRWPQSCSRPCWGLLYKFFLDKILRKISLRISSKTCGSGL